jgi:hypothetical protein
VEWMNGQGTQCLDEGRKEQEHGGRKGRGRPVRCLTVVASGRSSPSFAAMTAWVGEEERVGVAKWQWDDKKSGRRGRALPVLQMRRSRPRPRPPCREGSVAIFLGLQGLPGI